MELIDNKDNNCINNNKNNIDLDIKNELEKYIEIKDNFKSQKLIFDNLEHSLDSQQQVIKDKNELIRKLLNKITEMEFEKTNWNKFSLTRSLDKQLGEKNAKIEYLEKKNSRLNEKYKELNEKYKELNENINPELEDSIKINFDKQLE